MRFKLFAIALLSFFAVAGLSSDVAVASVAQQLKDGACAITDTCPKDGEAEGAVKSIISTVVDIFSWIVGVVAVIMIIVAGFKYITSGGDSGKVTSAKNTILYAVVGLIIVALAQAIVFFVIENVDSTTAPAPPATSAEEQDWL